VETTKEPAVTRRANRRLFSSQRATGQLANRFAMWAVVRCDGIHLGGMVKTSLTGLNAVFATQRDGMTHKKAIPYNTT